MKDQTNDFIPFWQTLQVTLMVMKWRGNLENAKNFRQNIVDTNRE